MSDVKDTNPKDAIGVTKSPLSVLSGQVLYELGNAMLEGALKYGRHNYREAGVRGSVYFDACQRHLWAYWEGEDIDPDSGVSHLVKAMACLIVWRDAQLYGLETDDRPPALDDRWLSQRANKVAKELVERYPEPKEPVTEVGLQKKYRTSYAEGDTDA